MHDKLLAGEDCLCETSRLDEWLRVCGSGRFPSPAIAGHQGWRTAMQRCCRRLELSGVTRPRGTTKTREGWTIFMATKNLGSGDDGSWMGERRRKAILWITPQARSDAMSQTFGLQYLGNIECHGLTVNLCRSFHSIPFQ
jgi:hypothetical protein